MGSSRPSRSQEEFGGAGSDENERERMIEELSDQLRRQADDFRELHGQIQQLQDRLTHLRLSLAHRIGVAIVENASPWRWLHLPWAVIKAIRGYRADKRAGKIETPGRLRGSASGDRIRRPPRDFLLQTHRLAAEIGLRDALAQVRSTYAELPSAVSLIEANYAADDTQWLACVNRYLARFDILPIELKQGTQPRFHRISASQVKHLEGPLVTVIVPAFNAQATIGHAVESILKQSWASLQIVVVDDCSSDGTWDILRSLARSDDRLTIIRNRRNVGPYVSKNRAIDQARGRWITGHDADDWAHPERIERQVQAMLRNPECRVSIGQMIRMDEEGRFTHFSMTGKTSEDGALRLCSISCFFDREYLERHLGHWDCVRFGADSEMIERARRLLGKDFMTFGLMTMFCLDSEGSLTNHPQHGVSKETGISDSRRRYRDSWMAWHARMAPGDAHLKFPPDVRKFEAPEEAVVNPAEILQLLRS